MKAKINGRDIEIPVTWGNITLLQHNKLKKANNDFEAIEILTGITQDELKIELQWLASIGEAKKRGSFIVPNESYYDM